VSDSDRIGGLNQGWSVAITTLMHERGAIGAGGTGSVGSVSQVMGLVRETPQTASERHRATALIVELEVARLTALRARASARAGLPPGPAGSGGKLRLSANLKELGALGVDLAGPAGVAGDTEAEWQTLFLTGPSISIRGGTDEIQRNILGERVLGLPPEPRVDKDRPFR
jgi:alkylation response protein AidB-like acyl-CoA dehydrogenase